MRTVDARCEADLHFVSSSSDDSALASYLPNVQLVLLASEQHASGTPYGERCRGAVLLIDIVGFSRLTEQFVDGDAVGFEKLSKVLGAYFQRMSDVIAAYGGDVLTFAGDAILAIWPVANSDDVRTSTWMAVGAARAVQVELRSCELPSNASLHQRAAVSAGNLSLLQLGGVNEQWRFMAAGEPIAEVGKGNLQAKPGEIVLSSAAWELVRHRCEGFSLDDGFVRLENVSDVVQPIRSSAPAPRIRAAGLEQFVMPFIVGRMRTGHQQWLAEFRDLTAVFVGLEEVDFGRTDGYLILDSALRAMQRILLLYEGALYQFLMDDKGIRLVAIFGIPSAFHEDDAVRAVKSALNIQADLGKLSIRCSIGIGTGRAFCGVLGSESRRQYTAVGTVMNRSSSLMQSAPGQVLCDHETVEASKRYQSLEFKLQSQIMFKGAKELTDAYTAFDTEQTVPDGSLTSYGTAAAHRHPVLQSPGEFQGGSALVGRDAEWAVLSDALKRLVQHGQGATIILEGEAGIGKSKLVQHLARKAGELNAFCFTGKGDSIMRSYSYFPWRTVFQGLLGLNFVESQEEKLQRIDAQLRDDSELHERLPLLGVVLPFTVADNSATAKMVGKIRAETTRHTLAQVLKKLTLFAPCVLFIEDAHWLDSSSLALVLKLSRQVPSFLFVITTRPSAESGLPELRDLLESVPARRIKLNALAPESALQIACDQMAVRVLPEAVAQFLTRHAGGQPLFIKEIVNTLRASRFIAIVDRKCDVLPGLESPSDFEKAFGELDIPRTVRGMIISRVDRVSSSQQLMLKIASVIGPTFKRSVIQSIYPLPEERQNVEEHLSQLASLEFIRFNAAKDDTVEFTHSLIQETVYASLSMAHRRQFHRAVAECYELRDQENLELYFPLLAYHWGRAEVRSKAMEYAAKAGSQALDSFANREAVGYFREAVKLKEQEREHPSGAGSKVEARWRLRLGRALVNTSEHDEAQHNLERGLVLLREKFPKEVQGTVFALIWEIVRQVFHRIRRSGGFNQGSDERELILEESRAYQALMEVYYLQGSPLRILLTSLRSLNLAELAGSSPELSRCYASFAAIMGLVPWHREAGAYFKRAAESASRVDSFESIEWSSLCEGTYRAGIGEWQEAIHHFDQMLATSRKLGDNRSNANALQGHAMVEYFRGEFTRSLQFSISFHASALQISEKRFEAEAIRWKTLNLLALGTVDEVPACLDRLELLRSNEKSTNILNYADVYSLRASLHLRLREYKDAFIAARKAAGRLISTPNTTHELIIERSLVAEVYLALWERIKSGELKAWTGDGSLLCELREGVTRACGGLRKVSRTFPVGSPVTLLRSGQQSYLRGRAKEGFAACLKSVDAAKRLGMVHVEASAEFEIGRHLPVGDSARKHHLDRACSAFRRIHATYDLAHAEAAARNSLS